MRRVHVRDVEPARELVAGQAGVPVVAVDELVRQSVGLDEALRVGHPLGNDVAHPLLADQPLAAARDPDDPHPLVQRLDRRLILESAGHDVDPVAKPGEGLTQAQDVHDLPTRVRAAELGLSRHVPVSRDHQDASRSMRHGAPFRQRT